MTPRFSEALRSGATVAVAKARWACLGVLLVGCALASPENEAPASEAWLEDAAADAGADCNLYMPACDPADYAGIDGYEALYRQVFVPSCANNAGDCHQSGDSHGAAAGGLHFREPQSAYEILLEAKRAYVVPGAPECSRLAHRILTDDPQRRMPRIGHLTDEEVCAVLTWIEAGAAR